MKRYIAAFLALSVTVCLWGCGRRQPEPTTGANDTADTAPTTPSVTVTIPTIDENIPDPTVDSNSTENGSLIDDITEMTGDHK